MVAVEVDEMSPLPSQLFKNNWWPYKHMQTPLWHHITVTFMWVYPHRSWFWLCAKCNDGGSWGGWHVSNVIPTLQRLDIGSIQHLMTLQRYTDTFLASHYSNIHVSIPPEILIFALHKVQWWWQLRWMKCLHCHPNSSKTWYRVHTSFDDPTKIYRHRSGITLQQHSCEYTPRSFFWHLTKCNDGGSWGGQVVRTIVLGNVSTT